MGKKRTLTERVLPYAGLFALFALIAWGPLVYEPIVRDDLSRNIAVPDRLLHQMEVQVAYNEEEIFFRFALPTDDPSYYHDYWVYKGNGEWHREGRSPVGRQPHGVYEDRISFFLDDGKVPDFGRYGGFVAVSGDAMRFFTNQAHPDELAAHPHFGPTGVTDVRHWLPETRTDPHDWKTVRPQEDLDALRKAGYFLDLWQWRSHRSNPVGWSDNQYIADYRWSDEGRGMYTTNWDEEHNHPIYMFDPELSGHYAMRWEKVLAKDYAQHEFYRYALTIEGQNVKGNAIPFDPDRDWQVGDVIPRRLLREPAGSRGDIRANGVYEDGKWIVELRRLLDTGNPLDDKLLKHMGNYQIAFAVHIRAAGSRWHYVSFPKTLGLGVDADIPAERFEGQIPNWADVERTDIKMFYPGQIDWSYLISDAHAGAEGIREGIPLHTAHTEEELADYAVRSSFRTEIKAQWRQTSLCMTAMMILVSLALFIATPRIHSIQEEL